MTDILSGLDGAIRQGFTQQISASGDCHDLDLLIRPGTDLDGTFRAFDINEGEFLRVNGWLFVIES